MAETGIPQRIIEEAEKRFADNAVREGDQQLIVLGVLAKSHRTLEANLVKLNEIAVLNIQAHNTIIKLVSKGRGTAGGWKGQVQQYAPVGVAGGGVVAIIYEILRILATA